MALSILIGSIKGFGISVRFMIKNVGTPVKQVLTSVTNYICMKLKLNITNFLNINMA